MLSEEWVVFNQQKTWVDIKNPLNEYMEADVTNKRILLFYKMTLKCSNADSG